MKDGEVFFNMTSVWEMGEFLIKRMREKVGKPILDLCHL